MRQSNLPSDYPQEIVVPNRSFSAAPRQSKDFQRARYSGAAVSGSSGAAIVPRLRSWENRARPLGSLPLG